MTILALYHIKGGVGKTAAAVNLAFIAASEGNRTLLCDLDPQSSATYYLRIKPKIKPGIKPLIKGKKPAAKYLKESDFENLDLMPSDFSLRNMDLVLENSKDSKNRLKKFLNSFKKDYHYIFIDCPPNITLVSENIFHAADIILVPVIPTTLSLRTFEQLLKFFKQEKLRKKKLVPFFSMVELRKKMHKESIQLLKNQYQSFLHTEIPYSSVVEKMGIYRAPLATYKPNSIPSQRYLELWLEIKNRLNSK